MKIMTTLATTTLLVFLSARGVRATEVPPSPKVTTEDAQSRVQTQVQLQVQADGVQVQADGDGNVVSKTIVVRVGPDGAIELKDTLPADVEKKVQEARKEATGRIELGHMQGSITVIGPDGVKRTQTFGDNAGPMPDLQQILEKSLEAAGADLPDDVRQKLKQAFRNQGKEPGRNAVPMKLQAGGPVPTADMADMSRKLDRILDRLEQLEQKIEQLKDSNRPEKE